MNPLLLSAHAKFISIGVCVAPASRETMPTMAVAVSAARIKTVRPTRILLPPLPYKRTAGGPAASPQYRSSSERQYFALRRVFQEEAQTLDLGNSIF